MNQNLNGYITVANQEIAIARESDFEDLVTFTSRATQFSVLSKLKDMVKGFGERRSPAMDLYRQRLSQLRQHLSHA